VKPIPEIKIERGGVSGGAVTDHTKIAVRRLRITGALAYSADKLIAVAGFRPGAFTLAELRAMAERITSFYRKHGYFVARAYIPAQEIHDDTITIAVVEGRYGQVSIQNGTNLSNHLAQQLLGKVQSAKWRIGGGCAAGAGTAAALGRTRCGCAFDPGSRRVSGRVEPDCESHARAQGFRQHVRRQ